VVLLCDWLFVKALCVVSVFDVEIFLLAFVILFVKNQTFFILNTQEVKLHQSRMISVL